MNKSDFLRLIGDPERAVGPYANSFRVAATNLYPFDPKLAAMYDDVANRIGDIVAHIRARTEDR